MIPKPVLAYILLFPINEETERVRASEDEAEVSSPKDLWFMKQFVGNACGTIAVFHSIANNRDRIRFTSDDAFLPRFLQKSESLDPEARGHLLEEDEEIEDIHQESAQESTLDDNMTTNIHFVSFVRGSDGIVYEMDGRRAHPQPRGEATEDNFVQVVSGICRERMRANPNDWTKFSAMALVGK